MRSVRFVSRQISEITRGGGPVVSRKVAGAVRAVLALPLFIFMRLVRPWILLRLGPLNNSRIGHFAANTELYLCERKAGINVPGGRHLDLCYLGESPLANAQLKIMWARRLRLWPEKLLAPVFRLNRMFPGGSIHEVGNNTQSDRDVHDLLSRAAPHLGFTHDEEVRGKAGLEAMRIPDGAAVVCLIARDNSYLKTLAPHGRFFEYHDYRDSDIQNYVMAAEALADRGCYVLRMGAVVETPFASNHPRVIDYATSAMRSEFMDIYLGAHCLFCLSSGTGYDSVPTIFRKPIAYVNLMPIGYLPTYVSDSIGLSKRFWLTSEQRWLSLGDIFSHGVGFCLSSTEYPAQGVELVENTPAEIRDVAIEMLDRLEAVWQPSPNDDALQHRFWETYPTKATDSVQHRPLHGTIRMRYGAQFLRDHPEFLNSPVGSTPSPAINAHLANGSSAELMDDRGSRS